MKRLLFKLLSKFDVLGFVFTQEDCFLGLKYRSWVSFDDYVMEFTDSSDLGKVVAVEKERRLNTAKFNKAIAKYGIATRENMAEF